jgi:Ca2+-binding EF-hand superfamily protein
MKLLKSVFVGAAAFALASGAAFAADEAKNDPGFNALDKNNDGYITRAEAAGDAGLAKKFKDADKNNDGKLSRIEYLTTKTVQDAKNVKDKVSNKVNKEKAEARAENRTGNASTGTSRSTDTTPKGQGTGN